MRQPKTWLLVADSGSAAVYRTTGRSGGHAAAIEPVDGGRFRKGHEPRQLGPSPGRNPASPLSQMRPGMQIVEPKEWEEKENFLLEVLAWLVAPSNLPQFEYLVVAAPPLALGDLRAAMPKKLLAKVSAEIQADLTKTPVKEIEQRVAEHLWPVRSSD